MLHRAVLIVRVFVHVPELRAVLQPQRSAPTTVKLPLQTPQRISPDKSRLLGVRRTPATRSGAVSSAATASQIA
jgi:hypothetical protein